MNLKEEFVLKLIEATNKKNDWIITPINKYREYLLDRDRILRVFMTKYKKSIVLIVEKRYVPEEQYYNNEINIFEELLYEIYIIESDVLNIIIHQNELSIDISKKLIESVIVKCSDEYLNKLLNEK